MHGYNFQALKEDKGKEKPIQWDSTSSYGNPNYTSS